MNKFSNMKIQINETQLLDEVVREFGRLGYKSYRKIWGVINLVESYSDGVYCFYNEDWHVCKLTTLAELKGM